MHPKTDREELYQEMINAFCEYGKVADIVPKSQQLQN
jgi:hypothetical protein